MKKFRLVFVCLPLVLAACGGGGGSATSVPPPPPPPPAASNDTDGDTIANSVDNCPSTANTDQADADFDGAGDVCDAAYGVDADGDGLLDSKIEMVEGSLASDTYITIKGSGFTEKTNPKPYFWWTADGGDRPSSLGRKSDWDRNSFGIGSFSTAIVAPGSQRSIANDHGGNSGASLSHVYFDSPQLYLYRKTYEDFDITKDIGLRTRVTLVSGTLNVGDVVTGQTSGASATIILVRDDNNPGRTHALQYGSNGGTLSATPPLDFINGEQLTTSSGAVATNTEPGGVFRSFNFKTVRLSTQNTSQSNNMYFGAQGIFSASFQITPENTDGSTFPNQFNIQQISQLPREWKAEELQYQTSGIGVTDGIFLFYQKGVLGNDTTFRNRNTANPERYDAIVNSQVSNGAQPGSVMYYDSLYIEDTWHRVIICSGATIDQCADREVQIPREWADNQITVQLRLGGLDTSGPLYLYVFGENGLPNTDGWQIAP
ncbi:MAG: thrombospondin type 3 repeat-containing protein [Henriciella sp.]|nr:thrombospondin type 3 repeat-containing protein [Henriciella sp.]